MVKIFDAHAHLDCDWYDEDRDNVIQSACEALLGIINPGTDMNSSRLAFGYAQQFANIYAGVGFHPHEAKMMQEGGLDVFAELCKNKKVIAIGEIGLDYYYDYSPKDVQKRVFIEQLDLARQMNLPVIIHNRDAHGDIMDIIKTEGKGIRGMFHCYSGSLEMAKELLKMGWYLSFGGSATFKAANKLREVVRYVPDERILFETDAPYLAPEPHRGKRNTPNMVNVVIQRLALERNQDIDLLANLSNKNIYRLFDKIENIE